MKISQLMSMPRHLAYSVLLIMCLILLSATASIAQSGEAVGTLIPPTPVPIAESTNTDILPSTSTVARLQADGLLRVGILYNEAPYGEYNIRGEVTGFDADLARKLAETWGIEIAFVQVTRQNRFEMLRSGDVDMLMGAIVHDRELDSQFEFSQSYHVGRQAMLVRSDDNLSSIFNLANRPVGYVIGTEGETALNAWQNRTGVPIQAQPYLILDSALSALFAGELDAIVARDSRLIRISANQPDAVTLLDDAISEEPYAVALLRQDVYMRNLVNRTLQYLLSDAEIGSRSTLEQLHSTYFPGEPFSFDALPIYNNVGDTPQLSQFGTDIPFPQGYVIPRLQSGGVLRIAGVQDPSTLAPNLQRIAQVNRSIVEQMAARWGVQIEFIQGDAIALIESGQADLTVGIEPDWGLTARVDFSQPYLLHGDRLMASADRNIRSFNELRGRIVATIIGDEGARDRADAWGGSINVPLRFFETTQERAAITILDDRNADVLYGDSLLLLPIYQFNTGEFEFGERWYSREYLTFAVPRNDIDFRLLVDYTLQEFLRDGTLATVLAPVLLPDESPPQMGIYPGSSTYLGFNLGR
ncbi:MAG: transporter substrate-binding domain-containing protein [Anaerolineae bacterium]|nr:transporter substrate-binding domain-containing protein [Anaerolineae bacterium]